MPTSENAVISMETTSDYVDYELLTNDSGDLKTFNSLAELWSGMSGKTPTVRPNGLLTGGAVTAGSANNTVDVAALTCYLAGVKTTVAAASGTSVARGSGDGYIKSSVTVTAAGAIAVVQGSESDSFSDTRGAAGGPPWIPTGSIEIAQVWYSATADAVVADTEIKSVVGTHVERADYPMWNEDSIRVESGELQYAGVTFTSALPAIHSDDAGSSTAGKKVYASYYEPVLTELDLTSDFTAPEISHSVSSEQLYQTTLASISKSLGQGSFNIKLKSGVSGNKDAVVKLADEKLWFKFQPDELETDALYVQAKLAISREFAADDQRSATCTLSAEEKGVEVYA